MCNKGYVNGYRALEHRATLIHQDGPNLGTGFFSHYKLLLYLYMENML